MPKTAPRIELTEQERTELEIMARKPSTAQGMAMRVNIILMAAEGVQNKEIQKALGVNKNVVSLWRNRFRFRRIGGLQDMPGRGRKRTYGHDERLRVIAKGCEKPPAAQTWTVRDLADALKETGISKSTVGRILKDIDLKPHKVESWLNSKDPDFDPKAAEICGLYLAPPENALVVSVDEKTGIQALGRKYPDKPERPGCPRKREFEYKRTEPSVCSLPLWSTAAE